METKVKQMCYDMMISVLEEHSVKMKSHIGFKPRPLKKKRVEDGAEHETSSFVKISSIDES